MTLKIPYRKILYFTKIVVVLVIFGTSYLLLQSWRHDAKRIEENSDLYYEMQIQEDEAKIVPGLGEGGVEIKLTGDDLKHSLESVKKNAMNVYLSDKISLKRTLKDYRHPWCARKKYDAVLPSTSVVIVFHNEPLSAILRTVWGVLNTMHRDLPWYKDSKGYPGQDPRSPYVFLKEIILVDDNSTLPELKGKLEYYVRSRLPKGMVNIVRLPQRWGLMAARSRGVRASSGTVCVFLDAHCEPGMDWARPLLQRIKYKHDVVTQPLIDVIRDDTMAVEHADTQIGGFTFGGSFIWIDVPDREKQRRETSISPTRSPTMAGGLFAINRAYFWHLGGYDEMMAGWGGENLEISFRIWQCGGSLETLPCSRVGHVFRAFHPYGLPMSTDTHGINTARMAEVWMDEYKELYYMMRPDLRGSPKIGDVTHRRVLREKLHCKSFRWFLRNIYPEKFIPVYALGYGRFYNPESGACLDNFEAEGNYALGEYGCYEPTFSRTQCFALSHAGQLRDEQRCATAYSFRNPTSNTCLDNMQREQHNGLMGIYTCHETQSVTQSYALSHQRQLRNEEFCAAAHRLRNSDVAVIMLPCVDNLRNQKWLWLPTNQLQHVESSLCLSAIPVRNDDEESLDNVSLKDCKAGAASQIWMIDFNARNNYSIDGVRPLDEEEIAFDKIRKQHRISSRSLDIHTDQKVNNNF